MEPTEIQQPKDRSVVEPSETADAPPTLAPTQVGESGNAFGKEVRNDFVSQTSNPGPAAATLRSLAVPQEDCIQLGKVNCVYFIYHTDFTDSEDVGSVDDEGAGEVWKRTMF